MRPTTSAAQESARSKRNSKRYHLRQKMTVEWVKLHEPDVWEQIRGYVDRRHA